MTGFDDELRSLLDREANEIVPDERRRRAVVTRVARRRALRVSGGAIVAAAVGLAVVTGGGTVLSAFERDDATRPAAGATASPDANGRIVAEGVHDGRGWTLSIVDDPDAAHPEDTESESPEVLFEIEGAEPNGGAFETHSDWEVVNASFQDRISGAGEYVMGMVAGDAASVTVELDGDESVEAEVFRDGESRYFLAFLPGGARGAVVARDEAGAILGSAALPGPAESPRIEIRCPGGSHAGDRAEPGADRYPELGRGTFEGRRWTLSLIEDPDAAHPEDLESENPELAFEIAGARPNGGSMETYGGWDGVSEPFYDRLAGGATYAFGMTSEAAASVTVEPDGGESVEAELFDARGVPRRGSQVYLAFLPGGVTGEVVARDVSGAVIGRAPLPELPEIPDVCEES